jgi:hypothetical protein
MNNPGFAGHGPNDAPAIRGVGRIRFGRLDPPGQNAFLTILKILADISLFMLDIPVYGRIIFLLS